MIGYRDLGGRRNRPVCRGAGSPNTFSIRLCVCQAFLLLVHQLHEAVEQVMAVLRAGRGLGVVLHREGRAVGERDAAIRAVEQRDVGLRRVRRAGVAGSTAKPWFIEVISTLPVVLSLTGWFAPWWPWCIFMVLPPTRQAQHLVAEADAEGRHLLVEQPSGSPARHIRRSRPDRRGRSTGTRRRASSASTSSAVAVAGTTVTLQPAGASSRRMLRFTP